MAVQFACPKCGRQLRVADSSVGQEAKCPKCENVCEVSELYARSDEAPNPFASDPIAPNPYAASNTTLTESAQAVTDKDSRTWAMAAHLLGLTFPIFPFANIIGPLVVWLVKKDELPFAAEQAKESLNFQITITGAAFALGVLGLLTCGFTWALLIVPTIAGLVLPIVAGIKANDGLAYRYPCTLRLIP